MTFFIHDIDEENVHYRIRAKQIVRSVWENGILRDTVVPRETWSKLYEILRQEGHWNLEDDESATFAYNLIFGMGDEYTYPENSIYYAGMLESLHHRPVLEGNWRDVLKMMEAMED